MRATRSAQMPHRDLGRLPDRRRPRVGPDSSATGRSSAATSVSGSALTSAMERPANGHRERLRPQPAAVAVRAGHAPHEPQRPVAHPLALGVGQHVHDVLAGAPELARSSRGRSRSRSGLISTDGCSSVNSSQSRSFFAAAGATACRRRCPRPRHDAAQVGALPGARPGRDRALADAQRRVRDQQVLGDVVHDAQPVAARAGAGRGVGRERLGRQPGGARRGRCRRASRASAAGWTAW